MTNLHDLFEYCLSKPGAWQDDPWGGDVVVKVGSKVFAFFGDPESGTSVGLKCGANADEAREWIDRYPQDAEVSAYVGRFGWNRLTVGGAIPADELREAVDLSYLSIASRLPKRERPEGYEKA